MSSRKDMTKKSEDPFDYDEFDPSLDESFSQPGSTVEKSQALQAAEDEKKKDVEEWKKYYESDDVYLQNVKIPAHILGAKLSMFSSTNKKATGMGAEESCAAIRALLAKVSETKEISGLESFKKLTTAMSYTNQNVEKIDKEKLITEVLSLGEPIVLPCGWEPSGESEAKGHSVGLYAELNKKSNKLVIIHCNRGAGTEHFFGQSSDKTVTIYELPYGKRACSALLSNFFYKKEIDAETFYQKLIKYLDTYQAEEIGVLRLKKQSIGNCSIVNKKSLLAGIEVYHNAELSEDSWNSPTSVSRKNYKKFTTECRKKEILNCIDRISLSKTPTKNTSFHILMELIEHKAEVIGKERNKELILFTIENLVTKLKSENDSNNPLFEAIIEQVTNAFENAKNNTDKNEEEEEEDKNYEQPIKGRIDALKLEVIAMLGKALSSTRSPAEPRRLT